jgi:hypothetical protein
MQGLKMKIKASSGSPLQITNAGGALSDEEET